MMKIDWIRKYSGFGTVLQKTIDYLQYERLSQKDELGENIHSCTHNFDKHMKYMEN